MDLKPDFPSKRVLNAWRHRACRTAVLFPLVGERTTRPGKSGVVNDDAILAGYKQLRAVWCKRIEQLDEERRTASELRPFSPARVSSVS